MLKNCPFCKAKMGFSTIYPEAVYHPSNNCIVFRLTNFGVDAEEWNKSLEDPKESETDSDTDDGRLWKDWTREEWDNAEFCKDCGLPLLWVADGPNWGHYMCVYCTWQADQEVIENDLRSKIQVLADKIAALEARKNTWVEVDGQAKVGAMLEHEYHDYRKDALCSEEGPLEYTQWLERQVGILEYHNLQYVKGLFKIFTNSKDGEIRAIANRTLGGKDRLKAMETFLLIGFIVISLGYIVERERRLNLTETIHKTINLLERMDHSYANGNVHQGIDEGEFFGRAAEDDLLKELKKAVE